MKLAIWGSTQTGKASLTFNIKRYYNLEKIRYKGEVEFEKPKTDSYVIKVLYDYRITDEILNNYFLRRMEDDCKHLFMYRQNLLSQYLAWQHNEAIDLGYNPDILDHHHCKMFIDAIKEHTSRIYNRIKHLNLIAYSYEEIFHSNKTFDIFNELDVGITREDIPHLIGPIKWEVQKKFKHTQARFTVDKGIEHFNYKKNYDLLKDIFCDEFMYIDNNTKTLTIK
jgi:hypothetical protein